MSCSFVKVLWLIRAPKGMVSKTHVVELKSKFVANDLDVVESRALHACLPSTFENDADGAKKSWRAGFRKRLKELLIKEAAGQIKPAEARRPVYKVRAVMVLPPPLRAGRQYIAGQRENGWRIRSFVQVKYRWKHATEAIVKARPQESCARCLPNRTTFCALCENAT